MSDDTILEHMFDSFDVGRLTVEAKEIVSHGQAVKRYRCTMESSVGSSATGTWKGTIEAAVEVTSKMLYASFPTPRIGER